MKKGFFKTTSFSPSSAAFNKQKPIKASSSSILKPSDSRLNSKPYSTDSKPSKSANPNPNLNPFSPDYDFASDLQNIAPLLKNVTNRFEEVPENIGLEEFEDLVSRVMGRRSITTDEGSSDDDDEEVRGRFRQVIPSPELLRAQASAAMVNKKGGIAWEADGGVTGVELKIPLVGSPTGLNPVSVEKRRVSNCSIVDADGTDGDVKVDGKEVGLSGMDAVGVGPPVAGFSPVEQSNFCSLEMNCFPIQCRKEVEKIGEVDGGREPAMPWVDGRRDGEEKRWGSAGVERGSVPEVAVSSLVEGDLLNSVVGTESSIPKGVNLAFGESGVGVAAVGPTTAAAAVGSTKATAVGPVLDGVAAGAHSRSHVTTSGPKESIPIRFGSVVTFVKGDVPGSSVQSKRAKFRFVAPEVVDGVAIVRPSWDVAMAGMNLWSHMLVGYFLDDVSFLRVEEFAYSVWKGLKQVNSNSYGFYFFQFESENYMKVALEGGPWMYRGQPLFLEKWVEGMSLAQRRHKEVPVWVKFRNVPLEYWGDEGLSLIASSVGRPLFPDAITASRTRLDYARVCVVVDISTTFQDHLVILLPTPDGCNGGKCRVEIEYEWRPYKCNKCLIFGHEEGGRCEGKKAQVSGPAFVHKPKKDAEWEAVKKKKGKQDNCLPIEVPRQKDSSPNIVTDIPESSNAFEALQKLAQTDDLVIEEASLAEVEETDLEDPAELGDGDEDEYPVDLAHLDRTMDSVGEQGNSRRARKKNKKKRKKIVR